MKIVIATDAWLPQINGVVRTLRTTVGHLTRFGHQVQVIHPGQFPRLPCAIYPEVELAVPAGFALTDMIQEFRPDAVHIATEGPVGFEARRHCQRRRLRFTTSYHTKFPEYLRALMGLPSAITYRLLRWFHGPASAVMTATPTLEQELRSRGFANRIVRWSRGVDTDLFHPRPRRFPSDQRPILMYVGRVSREKNVEAFLSLKEPGTKYVVGDGPAREELQRKYPTAVFLGPLAGEPLAEAFANADVLVFPSRTDTFGLVILEALASGVPVAAYPVPGPRDILTPNTGALDEDLGAAVRRALREGDPEACVALAARYRWEEAARQFAANLVPAVGGRRYFASMPTARA